MTNGSKLVKSTSVLNQPIKRPMKNAKKKKKISVRFNLVAMVLEGALGVYHKE